MRAARKPLTSDLLPTKCESPGCVCSTGPMYLHSRCHPSEPTWAFVLNGVLTVECAVCRKHIVSIKVG